MPLFSSSKSKSKESSSSSSSSFSPAPTTVLAAAPSPATNLSFAVLSSKPAVDWTVDETALWVEFIGLGEYSKLFKHHSISGQELVELTDADLVSLEVEKVGHRRKILSRLRTLLRKNDPDHQDDDDDETSSCSSFRGSEYSRGSNTNSSSSYTASAYSRDPDEVVFKCYFEDDIRIVKQHRQAGIQSLEDKVAKEYGRDMMIKYKDEDGDLVTLKSSNALQEVIDASKDVIRLFLAPAKSNNKASKSSSSSSSSKGGSSRDGDHHHDASKSVVLKKEETSVLEDFVDGVIVIDKKGVVVFFNKAAEKIFGYHRSEVISHNVRMLMSSDIAKKHNHYLRQYLRTGTAHVIGIGRRVDQCKKKNGDTFAAWLSVSENKIGKHRHTFTATIQELNIKEQDNPQDHSLSESEFRKAVELLDDLLSVAVVFNDVGVIQYVNKRAGVELGLTNENSVGKRKLTNLVSSLAVEENQLFSNGGEALDGLKREVTVDREDGTSLFYIMNITKTNLRHRRLFTALLQVNPKSSSSGGATTKSFLQEQREVISNLAVAAIIVDERGILQEMNKACQTLLNYTSAQVLGRNVAVLIADRGVASRHNEMIKNYLETGESPTVVGKTRDALAMARDGSYVPIKLSVTAQRRDGRVIFTGLLLPAN